MNAAAAAFALLPGLAIGSFLNVVASRLPLKRSLSRPRSACMHCGTEIRSRDNIPVVSYLLLRGRCRACQAPIGWRYPAVEILTALLIAACVLDFGLSVRALAACVFCAALVAVSATDLERRIVPNRVVLPASAVVLALNLVWHPSVVWPIAGLGAALFFFLAALAYPRGMGMGDVKLSLLIGVAVGKPTPVAIFLAMLLALVPSAVLFARHGRAARKMALPFAPFLAIGGLIGLFAGHAILHWYLGLT
ncbi:MAG TPA: prepilin peptidase [Gaiellaceae bacterium]|jgi:leader peptidase (prepilin peptidase)/N-methyltransferase|nr:prepilin peptidase [Gaiellaceae bacterium]